jgi:single stranded DNA-binding protein
VNVPEFHRLVAWNKLGELCAQLCNKGRKIYVSGRIQTRTFTGSDNIQRTITEIVIEDMILLDSRMAGAGTGMGTGMNYNQGQQVGEKISNEEVTMPTDDLAAEADLATETLGEDTKAKAGKKKKVADVEEEMVTEDKVNLDDIPF